MSQRAKRSYRIPVLVGLAVLALGLFVFGSRSRGPEDRSAGPKIVAHGSKDAEEAAREKRVKDALYCSLANWRRPDPSAAKKATSGRTPSQIILPNEKPPQPALFRRRPADSAPSAANGRGVSGLLGAATPEKSKRRASAGPAKPGAEVARSALPPSVDQAILLRQRDRLKEVNGAYGYNSRSYEALLVPGTVEVGASTTIPGLGQPLLAYTFQEVRHGDRVIATGREIAPSRGPDGDLVSYAHGAVEEHYLFEKDALEQVFMIKELSEPRSSITVQGRVATNLTSPKDGTTGAKLGFTHGDREVLSISDAWAIDAKGRRIALDLAYASGTVTMTVPASWVVEAALPIMIDPVVGGPITVRSGITDYFFYGEICDVAANPETTLWLVVWNEKFGTSNYYVYGQHVNSVGDLIGNPILIGSNPIVNQDVAVSYAPNVNRYFVAWSGYDQNVNPVLLGKILNGDGTTYLDTFTADDVPSLFPQIAPNTYEYGPRIAYDGTNWFVVYNSQLMNPQGYTEYDIRGRFVSNTGTLGSQVVVSSGPSIARAFVHIDFANVTYLMAWQEQVGTNQFYSLLARTMNTSGVLQGTGATVIETAGTGGRDVSARPPQSAAELASGQSKYLVTWGVLGSLKGQVFDQNLAPVTSTFEISPLSTNYILVRAAYSSINDEWLAVYTDPGVNYPNSGQELYARKVKPSGFVGGADRITTNAAEDRSPAIAWNSFGNTMLIAYLSGDSAPFSILAQRYFMAEGPLAKWTFDEGAGGVAHDSSGYQNHGTLSGGASWTQGVSGTAMSLDGASGTLTVANSRNLEPQAMTIAGWVKRNGAQQTWANVVRKTWQNNSGPTYISWSLQLNPGGAGSDVVAFNTGFTGGNQILQSSAGAIPDGVWTHVAATYDPYSQGPQKNLYINGALVASANETHSILYDTTGTGALYFGQNGGGGEHFAGAVDEFSYWGSALSAAQIEGMASGLLGYWKADEGTGLVASDSSGNNNHGALSGGASWTTGKIGQALSFDGQTGTVRIPRNAALEPQALTVAAWVKRSGTQTSWANVVRKTWGNNSGPTYTSWSLQLNPGGSGSDVIAFNTGHSGYADVMSSPLGTLPDGVWTHVTAVYDPSGAAPQKKLYLNGVLAKSETLTDPILYDSTATGDIYFGQNGGGGEYYTGALDEVKYYGRALSDSEILALVGSGRLLAYWKLDDGTGTLATDSTGNSNTGTLSGGVSWTGGLFGNALSFDGNSGTVRVPRKPLLEPTAITVTGWVKRDGSQNQWANLVRKTWGNNSGPTYISWSLQVNPSGENPDVLAFNTGYSGGTQILETPSGAIPDGAWTHVAATYDPSAPAPQKKLYVNGALVASATETHPILYDASSSGDLYMGQNGGGEEYFAGSLDEVRYYSLALSAQEIANLAFPSGLLGYWKLDEGSGTSAFDSSGNGNTGALSGGATWTAGQIGQALSFDGSSGTVRVPRSPILEPQAITVATWVKRNGAQSTWANIVRKTWQNNSAPTYISWSLQLNPGGQGSDTVAFNTGLSGGSDTLNSPSGAIPDGAWTHIAAVYDPAAAAPQKKLYVNGVLVASSNRTNPILWDATFTGDIYFAQNGGGGEYFSGSLDDIRYYGRALSDQEVAGLAQPSTLLGWWKLDEGSGLTAADSSGNDNTGLLSGGVSWTTGQFGNGLLFDGASGSVRIPRTTLLEPQAITVSAWVKRNGAQQTWTNVVRKTWGNNSGPTYISWSLQLNPNGSGSDIVAFNTGFSGGNDVLSSSAGAIPDGVWTHVAGVYDPTAASPQKLLYVNGTLVASTSQANAILWDSSSTGDIYFGQSGASGEFLKGSLDDVRYYGRALTASEVAVVASDGRPKNLVATAGNMQVTLTWSATPGATAYNIFRGETPGGPYPTVVATGVPATTNPSFVDTNQVCNNTTYYYVVTALSSYGESGYSNEASATPGCPPDAPDRIWLTVYSTVIDVEWTPVHCPAAGYNVYRRIHRDPPNPPDPWSGPLNMQLPTPGIVLNTKFRDATVSPGTTYDYQVKAVGP